MYLQVEDLVNFHHFVAKLFSLEDVSRHVCNKIEKDCVFCVKYLMWWLPYI